jgi:hypothetical protein
MISVLDLVKNLWNLGMDEFTETEGSAGKHVSKDGWEINTNKCLIHHHSGFRAEFRDSAIYSILNFPYEANIHDIRNWVKQAEYQLARLGFGESSR